MSITIKSQETKINHQKLYHWLSTINVTNPKSKKNPS